MQTLELAAVCSACQTERKAKGGRLPPRWKRHPETAAPLCPACWSARYYVRAVTVPIQGPDLDGNPTERGEAWRELRERLYAAWDLSTRLANWSVQQLQRLDIVRTAGMERLPPMPDGVYLYGLFGGYADRERWAGAAASAQSLMRTVEASWRASRWDVVWNYAASARTYRWPTPFPVHNRDWSLSRSDAGVWSVSLTLPGGRVVLRIRNDRTLHYQRRRLEQLLGGAAVPGEAALYARTVQGNDRFNGLSIRGPGGRQDYRVLLKLAAWFPRPEAVAGRAGEMLVRTGNDSLLYAEMSDEEPWVYHGDDLRRRVIGYRATLQRWRDDQKAERRFPAAVRRRSGEEQQRRATRHQNYVGTQLAEIAAMVAGLARRRKVATVVYDDSERGYLPDLNYSSLKTRLENKCHEWGIEFRHASATTVNETPASARGEQDES